MEGETRYVCLYAVILCTNEISSEKASYGWLIGRESRCRTVILFVRRVCVVRVKFACVEVRSGTLTLE